jgi:hypothetical protein
VAESTATVSARPTPQPLLRGRASGFFARPGWPLRVIYYGYPLWWVVGCAQFMFLAMAVPMAFTLLRRPVRVPRGFAFWLLFLVWVLASVLVLWTNVPGTVPVHGASRLFIFTYRALWYLSLTIVLLYVGNMDEEELPGQSIARMLGFMFVVIVLGGLLSIADPHLQFKSVIERVLPHGVTGNAFVHQIVHPRVAQVQSFLGFADARPSAPYYYTNAWGCNLSLCLPFFILAWRDKRAGWRRAVAPIVGLAALVPAIYSLNRGLWIGVIAMTAFVAVRLAVQGRVWAVRGLVGALLVGGLVFVASPLHSLVQQRLHHGHSNARRSDLAGTTFRTTADSSPIVGFGNTRRVLGNFSSIAGGARPDCPFCAAPPLGTQGHLWLVVVSQGLVGAALFLLFFVRRFVAGLRDRSPYAIAGTAVLVAAAVELPFYDMLADPLFTVMIAVAVLWRSEAGRLALPAARPAARLPVRRSDVGHVRRTSRRSW